jgi:predicted type IV restriction endonuclease
MLEIFSVQPENMVTIAQIAIMHDKNAGTIGQMIRQRKNFPAPSGLITGPNHRQTRLYKLSEVNAYFSEHPVAEYQTDRVTKSKYHPKGEEYIVPAIPDEIYTPFNQLAASFIRTKSILQAVQHD